MAWHDDWNNEALKLASTGARQVWVEPQKQTAQAPKKKGNDNFLASLLPTGGGVAGALGGAAAGTAIAPGVGTLIGALLGGALGGGGGKVAENAIEGNDIGQGVLEEAALNGVLGAGPLRLGKAAIDVGRGVKPAQGLADAILNAGEKNAVSGVAGKVNKAATQASQKGFGVEVGQSAGRGKVVTPDKADSLQEFITNGAQKYGGIRAGRPIDQATDAQSVYNNVIRSLDTTLNKIDRPVKKTEVNALIKSMRGNITSNPAVTGQAATLEKFVTNIKSAKSLKELESIRRQADDLAYTSTGAGKTAAAAQAHTVRDVIDGFITPLSKDYKAVKSDYTLARDALDSTSKAVKNAKGLPLPFTDGKVTVGDQAIQGFKNRVASIAGDITGGAPRIAAGNPYGVGRVAGRVLPGNAIAGPLMEMGGQEQATAPSAIPQDLETALIGAQSPEPAVESSPYPRENLIYDIQRDPKNADKYIAQYQALAEIYAPPEGSSLNATQQKTAITAQNALGDVDILSQAIQSGNINKGLVPFNDNPLIGGALGLNDVNAALFNIGDVILRSRTGAAAPKEEIEKFVAGYLPRAGESKETQAYKLQRAYNELVGMVNPPKALGTSTSGSLEDALMQGGYLQ